VPVPFVPSVVTVNLTMQSELDCVTVEVIPLGLANVEPHIPVPMACAGKAVMTLNPLIISRNARSPNPAFFGRETGVILVDIWYKITRPSV
jgi:hypothetical protein